jgi:hypothetical protein
VERKQAIQMSKSEKQIKYAPLQEYNRWSMPEDVVFKTEELRLVDDGAVMNALSFIHFSGGSILLHLKEPGRPKSDLLLRVALEDLKENELTCHLLDNEFGLRIHDFELVNVLIDDGHCIYTLPSDINSVNKSSWKITIRPKYHVLSRRETMRFSCTSIEAELTQNAFLAKGDLLEFSPKAFRIRAKAISPLSFHCFNSQELTYTLLRNSHQVLFSGMCYCIRLKGDLFEKEIVLGVRDEKISRFEKKPIRNPRQRLIPSPTVSFSHPFFHRIVQYEVSDISTSGLSVHENASKGTLLPGLIIPEASINFGAFKIKCMAQVVYTKHESEIESRCGLSLLDMNSAGYSSLSSLITSAIDPHAHNSQQIEPEILIKFFYDAGFIYEEKHHRIVSSKESFCDTYKKTYGDLPEIARHFAYQKNGQIYGHVSMLKAYEKTWMVHHHVAKALDGKTLGFTVLNQLNHFLNDMYRLPSLKTNYILCYFRPENKFPSRVFGGFARALKNPQGCSMDQFSYTTYIRESLNTKLQEGWTIKKPSEDDIWFLKRFYNACSGGLLLNAFGLYERDVNENNLEEIYRKHGLSRKCRYFSLSYNGELNALFIVDQSDPGLNLSDLLNSIKVLVTRPESLPLEILYHALSQLSGLYQKNKTVVLVFPSDYALKVGMPCERQYEALIWDAGFMNFLIEYIQSRFRIPFWK